MRVLGIALILALTPSGMALAKEPADQSLYADEQQINDIADGFFDQMKAGNTVEAYDLTLGASPLMRERSTERQTLVNQFNSALQIYGDMRKVEQVSEDRKGAFLIKRQYLAQHDKMLTRWTMMFAQLPEGWSVVYLSFDDGYKAFD